MSLESLSGSSLVSSLKLSSDELIESGLTAAIYAGVDKFYYRYPFGKEMLFVAAESFGADFLSDIVIDKFSLRSQPFLSDVGQALSPLVSGVLFSSLDHFVLKKDPGKSFLAKFLQQVGASLVASQVSAPVQAAINRL